jgi:hypothetical protein
MPDAEYEFGIEIKCLRCGGEDFTLQGGCRFSCDGCRDTYLIRYEEAGSEGDVRSESLSAGVHEASGRREKGSVYFISTDAPDSPIKIGHTTLPVEDRLCSLQTGNPHPLKVLACVEADIYRENGFHRLFASARIKGEWFTRTPELLAVIEAFRLLS